MREIFDNAYEALFDFIYLCESLGKLFLVIFVYLTIPLWILPYMICKKKKGGDE